MATFGAEGCKNNGSLRCYVSRVCGKIDTRYQVAISYLRPPGNWFSHAMAIPFSKAQCYVVVGVSRVLPLVAECALRINFGSNYDCSAVD